MSLIYDDKEKYDKLLGVSNPKKVIENAKLYLGESVKVYLSTSKNKKYMVINPDGRKVNFGDIRYQDFTFTQNEEKRLNYLARASKIKGNWKNDKYSPNNLSINLTWK